MKENDWTLLGAGFVLGVVVGGVSSAAMAGLFEDANSKATIYMGIVGFAGVIFTIFANGYMGRSAALSAYKERNSALAHSIIIKLVDMHSNLHHINSHFEMCLSNRENNDSELWKYIKPIANIPRTYDLSIDEITMVSSLGNDDILNRIINIGKMYNSDIDAFSVYCKYRGAFLAKLVPDQMDGEVGSATLTREQYMTLRPAMVELNSIIEPLIVSFSSDLNESRCVIDLLSELLREKSIVKMKVDFEK